LDWSIKTAALLILAAGALFDSLCPFCQYYKCCLFHIPFLYAYSQHVFLGRAVKFSFLLLTQSRGPILGLAMAFLYGGVNLYWFIALTPLLFYAIPYTLREFVGPYAFYTQRFHIWRAAWDMFVMRPFSGVGFATFPLALKVYSHPFLFQFFPFNHAHNILLSASCRTMA